ncbi:MAG: hypothetical protein HDQ96_07890 [Lachnospiraceae bacterium]|nr:hypothetical protein [Lachnospiraceae bacterium]
MKIKAYLTIYLTFSLTILLSVIMVLLAGIKKNTTRMEEEVALNTAGWSALAEYHQELLKQYDLFFIDTSYGSSYPGIEAIGDHVKEYANRNLSDTKLLDGRLALIDIQEAEIATDDGGEVLKQQIIEYEENYLGLETIENLFSKYREAEKETIDEKGLIKEKDENAAKLEAQKAPVRVVEKEQDERENDGTETCEETEEVPIEDPAAHVNELRKKGVLNLVVENTEKISDKAVRLEEYVSRRSSLLQGTGSLQKTAEKSLLAESKEKILLNAYIFQKFGYYGNEKENAALDYQVEYMIGGKKSDMENLKAVVNRLLLFREAANAAYLYGDAAKRAEISAMAASVAAVTLAPYLQPLLETSILFAWAYIESIQDVKLLLEGGKVPLLKTASDWRTDLNSILNFSGDSVDRGTEKGLTYQEYLAMLLLAEKEEKLLFPMMDIMEMDIRKTAYNENFRMDGCVSGFKVLAEFEDSSGGCSFIRTFCY